MVAVQALDNIESTLTCLGQFGAPYGVKGWVRVRPYTESQCTLLAFPEWHVQMPSGWQKLKILGGKAHNDHLVVQLEGCTDRDMAKHFGLAKIALPRSVLPELPADTHYWVDLIGLKVVHFETNEIIFRNPFID